MGKRSRSLWSFVRSILSVPSQLGDLANLHDLNLRLNQLTGRIPSELDNLGSLYYLYLDFNQLRCCQSQGEKA